MGGVTALLENKTRSLLHSWVLLVVQHLNNDAIKHVYSFSTIAQCAKELCGDHSFLAEKCMTEWVDKSNKQNASIICDPVRQKKTVFTK